MKEELRKRNYERGNVVGSAAYLHAANRHASGCVRLLFFFYVLVCWGVILDGSLDLFVSNFVEKKMLFEISENLP